MIRQRTARVTSRFPSSWRCAFRHPPPPATPEDHDHPGIWHLALGTWQSAVGTRHSAVGSRPTTYDPVQQQPQLQVLPLSLILLRLPLSLNILMPNKINKILI